MTILFYILLLVTASTHFQWGWLAVAIVFDLLLPSGVLHRFIK